MPGRSAQISWDSYSCDNADIIQIWRRVGSYDFDPENCEVGIPEGSGYKLINEVDGEIFAINVIPHTQIETISGDYEIGQSVYLEVDIIARYLERLVEDKSAQDSNEIDLEFLKTNGYD